MNNPLLNFELNSLPKFAEIKPEHIPEAVDYIISEGTQILERVEQIDIKDATWDNVVAVFDEYTNKEEIINVYKHLEDVACTDELQEAINNTRHRMVEFSLKQSQSKKLYTLEEALLQHDSLTSSQRRFLESSVRSRRLSGVHLDNEQRQEFNDIIQMLSKLKNEFDTNILNAQKSFSYVTSLKEEIEGLPNDIIERLVETTNNNNPAVKATIENGPWTFYYSLSLVMNVLKFAKSRKIRKMMHTARMTLAYDTNVNVVCDILKYRKRQAEILGYQNRADMSLESRMAGSVNNVNDFLEKLRLSCTPVAKNEIEIIKEEALKDGITDVTTYDMMYYMKIIVDRKFGFGENPVNQYFQLDNVLRVLIDISYKLFGVSIVERTGESKPQVWHEDVKFYDIYVSGVVVSSFYLDLFERVGTKQSGAWCNTCLDRYITPSGEIQRPVAFIICNFNRFGRILFDDISTLFHEFGHAFQCTLTQVNCIHQTGMGGIERDAIELPSQFMEYWADVPSVLKSMSCHLVTKEQLDDNTIKNLIESCKFGKGIYILRQLRLSVLDMVLHTQHPCNVDDIKRIIDEIGEKFYMYTPPDYEWKEIMRFTHIFTWDYVAGYYSYLWADVMSCDAFHLFIENNAVNPDGTLNDIVVKELGEKFKNTVMALGGSVHPMDVFKMFRGREPCVSSLLKWNKWM